MKPAISALAEKEAVGVAGDAASDLGVDVGAVLDSAPFGRVQAITFVLCLILMLLDGYEIYVLALLIQPIAADFGIAPSALTPVVVAQTGGLVAGSYLIAPLADRLGRRRLLIGCTAVFAALTALAAMAHGIGQLAAIRFLSAMAFSAAMANAFSLASEIFPARRRSTLLLLLSCGFVAGPPVAAAATAALLPSFGWRGLFVAGAIIPGLLLVPLWLLLPESLPFLVRRGAPVARIRAMLLRLAPGTPLERETRFTVKEPATAAGSVGELLRGRSAAPALLNWLMFLLSGTTIALLGAWLPTIYAQSAGLSYAEARELTAIFGISGLIATAVLGSVMGLLGAPARLLWPMFLVAAAAVLVLALADARAPLALAALVTAGASLLAAQGVLYSTTPTLYPTRLRATGVGWSVGAGRVGGLAGAMLGGALLAATQGMFEIFGLLAALLGCCALAGFLFWNICRS